MALEAPVLAWWARLRSGRAVGAAPRQSTSLSGLSSSADEADGAVASLSSSSPAHGAHPRCRFSSARKTLHRRRPETHEDRPIHRSENSTFVRYDKNSVPARSEQNTHERGKIEATSCVHGGVQSESSVSALSAASGLPLKLREKKKRRDEKTAMRPLGSFSCARARSRAKRVSLALSRIKRRRREEKKKKVRGFVLRRRRRGV